MVDYPLDVDVSVPHMTEDHRGVSESQLHTAITSAFEDHSTVSPPAVKNGIKTSELWVNVLALLIVAVLKLTDTEIDAATLAALAGPTGVYTLSRSIVKRSVRVASS